MFGKKKDVTTPVEWVGGIATMPAYIYGEGEPYRPEALFFMIPGGPVLGMQVDKPGALLPKAAPLFAATMRDPMDGPAHTPARVRVASESLAGALRPVLPPGTELLVAPTPELDLVLEAFREHLDKEGPEDEPSYLANDVSKETVASFFRATSRLYKAAPWDVVPCDQDILSVTIEQLGVRDSVVCVIGQTGQAYGLLLFESLDDFEAYYIEAEIAGEDEPDLPGHLAISFDNGADVHPALRKEVARHHFEVARASAFPQLMVLDQGLVTRPPVEAEYVRAEAIALALTEVLGDKRALRDAFAEEPRPFERLLRVTTHAGEMAVTLRAPFPPPERRLGAETGPLAQLAKLDVEDDAIDERVVIDLEEEIVRSFLASPEGQGVEVTHLPRAVMEFARNYLETNIVWLRAPDLREILFEIAPRKMVVDVSMAGAMVAECRAFFTFLKREYGFSQTDACLRLLSHNAEERLEEAFSDSSRFGIGKSLVMAGKDAGFDIESEEGLRAWMQEIEGKPLPPGIALPGLPPGLALPGTFPKPQRGAASGSKSKPKPKRKTSGRERSKTRKKR
jgi:hypothetical protein